MICVFIIKVSGQDTRKSILAAVEKEFYKGTSIRLTFVKENIVRIQIALRGGTFKEAALNRYGFNQDNNTAKLNVKVSVSGNSFSTETPQFKDQKYKK